MDKIVANVVERLDHLGWVRGLDDPEKFAQVVVTACREAIRNEALEEAAHICDVIEWTAYERFNKSDSEYEEGRTDAACDAAAAIRALKSGGK